MWQLLIRKTGGTYGSVCGWGGGRWGIETVMKWFCIILMVFYPYLGGASPSFTFLRFSEPSPKRSSHVSFPMISAEQSEITLITKLGTWVWQMMIKSWHCPPWCVFSDQCPTSRLSWSGLCNSQVLPQQSLPYLLLRTIAKAFRNVPSHYTVNFLRAEVALLCTWSVASILYRACWHVRVQEIYE